MNEIPDLEKEYERVHYFGFTSFHIEKNDREDTGFIKSGWGVGKYFYFVSFNLSDIVTRFVFC